MFYIEGNLGTTWIIKLRSPYNTKFSGNCKLSKEIPSIGGRLTIPSHKMLGRTPDGTQCHISNAVYPKEILNFEN